MRPRRIYQTEDGRYYYLINKKRKYIRVPPNISQKQLTKINILNIIPEGKRLKKRKKRIKIRYGDKVVPEMKTYSGLPFYFFQEKKPIKQISDTIKQFNPDKTADTTTSKLTDILTKIDKKFDAFQGIQLTKEVPKQPATIIETEENKKEKGKYVDSNEVAGIISILRNQGKKGLKSEVQEYLKEFYTDKKYANIGDKKFERASNLIDSLTAKELQDIVINTQQRLQNIRESERKGNIRTLKDYQTETITTEEKKKPEDKKGGFFTSLFTGRNEEKKSEEEEESIDPNTYYRFREVAFEYLFNNFTMKNKNWSVDRLPDISDILKSEVKDVIKRKSKKYYDKYIFQFKEDLRDGDFLEYLDRVGYVYPEEEGSSRFTIKSSTEGSGNVEDGLYNDEIEKVLKRRIKDFVPVIPSDKVDDLLPYVSKGDKRFGFIINTNPSYSDGSGKDGMRLGHWRACYFNNEDDFISAEYFDPLAEGSPEKPLLDCMRKIAKKMNPEYMFLYKQNNLVRQPSSSSNCGWHCIKFLDDRFQGVPFSEASGYDKFMEEYKPEFSEDGEKEIKKYLKKYKSYI